MTFEIEWYGDQVLNASKIALDTASKKIAEMVMEDAKKILKQKAETTTDKGLLSQFYVDESLFKNGGYLVWCQGPKKWWGKYHASFFELGNVWIHPYGNKSIPKINLPANPFMRPAARKNKHKATKVYQDSLDAYLKAG